MDQKLCPVLIAIYLISKLKNNYQKEKIKLIKTTIIEKYKHNPILTKTDIPYPAELIFNAGVTKYQGKYVMVNTACVALPMLKFKQGTSLGFSILINDND